MRNPFVGKRSSEQRGAHSFTAAPEKRQGAHAREGQGMAVFPWACAAAALVVVACVVGMCVAGRAIAENAGMVPSVSMESADGANLQSTADYRKTEVVYATLDAMGAPLSTYVVNQFEVKAPGRVVDYGAYDSVQNLSTADTLRRAGDATLFDMLDTGVFYYQGNSADMQLPWLVDIEYTLDGQRITDPAILSGAEGSLEIHLATAPNPAVDQAFYRSFLQQITFTLPGDACSDIQADGATIASAGSNRSIAFTALPGHVADCTVRAQVRDFHMGGVQIAALPYTSFVDMPDATSFASSMQQLVDAVSMLNVGAGGISDGTRQLAQGVTQLADGVQQIDAEMIGSYVGLAQDVLLMTSRTLYDMDMPSEEQLLCLAGQLEKLADFLDWLAGIDTCALDVPDCYYELDFAESAAKLRAISEVLSRHAGQISQLMAEAADPEKAAEASAMLGELTDGLIGLKDGVLQLRDGANALAAGTGEYADGMAEFNEGISAMPATISETIDSMMADYSFPEFTPHSFVSARNDMAKMANVQFVIQSAAVDAPAKAEAPVQEKQETFWDRVVALFKR